MVCCWCVGTQELYPSGHRRITRYYDVDEGQRDVVYIDWSDIVYERSRRTGVITQASLLDRAANNFTATINYTPDDSPFVHSQSITYSAGGQTQGYYNQRYSSKNSIASQKRNKQKKEKTVMHTVNRYTYCR